MKIKSPSVLLALPLLLLASAPLMASPIYPTADLRIQDSTGNGFGDNSHAEDNVHEVLNVGDNAENQVWRSVIKFDVGQNAEELKAAGNITFQATIRNRLIQVPKDWTFEIVSFPSQFPDAVLFSPSGDRTDEYSAEGEVIYSAKAGTLKTGEQIQIDVTDAVKQALAGDGILALRLQLDPATNEDGVEDQVSFFAGSHEVNTPHLRPQLIVNP